ncbi:MAG TPA: radical SAM protein [Anaeromyxobacter sp.]|nr:radical SAM protein [Anaeromyxobacter sp.]
MPETSDERIEQRPFALGLGLTNACNLSCSFCYRDPTHEDRLDLGQVQAVLGALPLRSVNLGTGENGMHPDFGRLLDWLARQPVKLTITSNGHTVAGLADEQVRRFHDVELSLDYSTEKEQDAQRGTGNWKLLHEQADRCVRLGVPVTFISVMMRSNFRRLAEVALVAKRFGAPLRVNVYQSVRTDLFALRYGEYWEGFERLFGACDAISIGEPLVRAMAGLPPRSGGCGRLTVRVTPRATVQPCVYWLGPGAPLATLLERGPAIVDSEPFREARGLPAACEACSFRETCGGGCAGRRQLQRKLGEPDPYCPIVRGEPRRLEVRMARGRDLPKTDSACTTIVIAR